MTKTMLVANVPEVMELIASKFEKEHGEGVKLPILYIPGNTGRIDCVEQWIFENSRKLHGAYVFQTFALGSAAGWEKAVTGGITPVTPFIGPGVRALVNRGLASNIRCNLSNVPNLFKRRWRPDVAFAHVSPPNQFGLVTLGLSAGLDYTAVKNAKFKIAVVNSEMPRWYIGKYYDPATGRNYESGCPMRLSEFDLVVHTSEPLMEHRMLPREDQRESALVIADKILEVLSLDADREGNLPHTIQLGIGMIPNALASRIAERKLSVQGVWSEMFSDGVLNLYRNGLIKNTGGFSLREHVVVGFVLGTKELYWTMHENSDFVVLPQEIVNDPTMIKHNRSMVSVNATIAVSLTGEVAAATIKQRYHSDVGGQFDFAQGASLSENGTSFIALLSTAQLRDGSLESKIVAVHSEGAHHTISADLPIVVVTEHGIADLRQLVDTERVEAMLQIAHPDWRIQLAKEARKLPSMQGVGVIPARLALLRSGQVAILRPATDDDIPAIREYIPKLNDDDRRTRYMGTTSVVALTSPARLTKLYADTLDYRAHAAFLLELDGSVIGVAHAFKTTEDGFYEISFSRRSDQAGQDIGVHLMRMLIDWGVATKAKFFHAVTYRTENPRMRTLFDQFGFTAQADPDDFSVVVYAACVADLAATRES